VIEIIQQHLGVPWTTPTVDTFKAGDPSTPVTGVALTAMATLEVLTRAAAAGKNLVITHEPTFYSHQDGTAELEKQSDPVYTAKQAFIREHRMVVWRFHDHWHRRRPDGIATGMVRALGWEKRQRSDDPLAFTLPPTTLRDLASAIKKRLGIVAMRVVGDPAMKLTNVAFLPGASGSKAQLPVLARKDVEALLIGEVPEWETVAYVDDAVAAGHKKALLLLTHIPSEQAGMDECARWLRPLLPGVPVAFVPAKQPFWLPK
jgi:putative NIF3 family GTP cyclohydrolase 1 type 2